jgi:microcystin-dependent protein
MEEKLYNSNNLGIKPGTIKTFASSTIIAPIGWLFCDGSEISRTTYRNLFNIIGTIYGIGDGLSTFNLPDSRGTSLLGVNNNTLPNGQNISYSIRNISSFLGEENHALISSELPQHNHAINHSHSIGSTSVTSGSTTHSHTHNLNSGGTHNHTITYDLPGGGSSNVHISFTNYASSNSYIGGRITGGGSHTHTLANATLTSHRHSLDFDHSHTLGTQSSGSSGTGASHNNMQPSKALMCIIKY